MPAPATAPDLSSTTPATLDPVPPLGLADWLGIVLTTVLFLWIGWLHAHNTMFWSDEVMGWLVVREHSFPALLHSWWAGADSSGIFFYVFARPWLALFGATPLALRLFSATGVALAAALLWLCARQFFRFEVVAALLPAALLTSGPLVWQLANSRTYGIFLVAIALAALAFALTDPDPDRGALTPRLLLLTFCAHLLLIGSHILGPLYSALLLAGLAGRDLWQTGRLRPRLYLAGAAAWLLLVLTLPNIRATMALGKPSFWTLKPFRHELYLGFTDFSLRLRAALLLLFALNLLAWALTRRRRPPSPHAGRVPRADRTRLALILTLFACVPTLFLISRVTTSIFVDRYLLPVLFADTLLLCELNARLFTRFRIGPRLRLGWLAAMLLVLASVVHHDLRIPPATLPFPNYTGDLAALLPAGTPTVISNPGLFSEMCFYQGQNLHLLMPVDWPVVLHSRLPGTVSGAHEMDTWKSLGYFAEDIQPTDRILAENPTFLVVAPAVEGSDWLRARVLSSPRFAVTDLGLHPEAGSLFHLWRVTRQPGAPGL